MGAARVRGLSRDGARSRGRVRSVRPCAVPRFPRRRAGPDGAGGDPLRSPGAAAPEYVTVIVERSTESLLVTQPLDPGEVHRLVDGTPLEEVGIAAGVDIERRRLLVNGLTWGMLFQAIEMAVSFAAML